VYCPDKNSKIQQEAGSYRGVRGKKLYRAKIIKIKKIKRR
jgi:hypothetical protein